MKLKFVSSHWDSFYSFEEVETLYQSGISHVRIPVGYWIVDTEPGFTFFTFFSPFFVGGGETGSVNHMLCGVRACTAYNRPLD